MRNTYDTFHLPEGIILRANPVCHFPVSKYCFIHQLPSAVGPNGGFERVEKDVSVADIPMDIPSVVSVAVGYEFRW